MNKKHSIVLSDEQRLQLVDLVKKGKAGARKIRRAHTLLMASSGSTDEAIAKSLHISRSTVERTRKQFCLDCLSVTLSERPRSGKPPKITSTAEAYLIATTCSAPPDGSARWTLKMSKVDFAHCMKELVDVHFPEAIVIKLVMDNLNTHTIGALYEVFTPSEARRIAKKLEIHHTPKHGSWLNMVECELSVLARQCLNQRIPNIEKLEKEVSTWEHNRNSAQVCVNWRFRTEDARIKLLRIYPTLQN